MTSVGSQRSAPRRTECHSVHPTRRRTEFHSVHTTRRRTEFHSVHAAHRTVFPSLPAVFLKTTTLFSLLVLSATALAQHQLPFPRDVDAPAGADSETFGESDLATSIAPFVDGDLTRSFEAIRGHVAAERYDQAVEVLGRLLEQRGSADVFLARRGNEETERSLAAEARRLLAGLPAESRARYEAEFGPAARTLLSTAVTRDDPAALHDVAVRYLHTQAGAEALLRLGALYRDRGRAREAALCWQRVRKLPQSAAFEPLLSLRLAAAWTDCGEAARSRQVIERLAESHPAGTLRVGGAQAAWSDRNTELLEKLIAPAAGDTAAEHSAWPVFRGNPARQRPVIAGDPLLFPRWSQTLTNDAASARAVEQSARMATEVGMPRLPMLHPVAVDDLVLVRSGDAVRAFDFHDGRLRWTCPIPDDSSDLAARVWTDSAHGSLAADRRAFYTIETEPANPPLPATDPSAQGVAQMMRMRMRHRFLWAMGPGFGLALDSGEQAWSPGGANLLAARALRAPLQGNLRWRVGGGDGYDEPLLAGMQFLGSPLPHAGRIYALAERSNTIHLVVLDADSGRLNWLQPLATVPQALAADPFRRTVGATPSLSDNVVVCPTSCGGVVAVDLVLRSLLWVYRYPRRSESLFAPDEGRLPVLDQRERWIDPTAVIADGRVLLAPPESDHLHCLDLDTGRLLWRRDRDGYLFVGAVRNGHVLLIGPRQVFALRLDDGKPAWTIPAPLPDGSLPGGHGVHAGRYYYLPLSNASLAVMDFDAGWITRTIRSPRQTVLGNLIHHRGSFIVQGAAFLEACDELEPLRRRVERALEADPHDGESLARLGKIELAAGNLDGALSAFRRAWAANPSPHTRNLLAAALFDALRALPERTAELSAELDTLVR
ncbi:MAG TPA: PQQ-binding-like beta-propeller repeat protein [Planctomycetaceae bacterium]|nr:PQQ-binding-like beta-propeller repeat protein [Planctomycetaceae bacterium]